MTLELWLLIGMPLAALGIYSMICRPRVFYFLYILLTTQLFGFLPMEVGMQTQAVLLFVHAAMLCLVLYRLAQGAKLGNLQVITFLVAVSVFWLFGNFYPKLMGFSTVTMAVINGKDFLGYVGLPYLLLNREEFDLDFLERLFIGMGAVLVVILIVGRLTGFVPPAYFLHEEKNFIHVNHILYFTMGAFLAFSRWISGWKPKDVGIFLFLSLGIVIQGHRSVLIVTLFGITALTVIRGALPVRAKKVLAVTLLVCTAFIAAGALGFSNPLFEKSTELVNLSEDPLAGRENANLNRFILIAERPLLGYGFISKDSTLGNFVAAISIGHFDESMGVIDSGYVDLVIRFGFVGALLFCAAYVSLLISFWLRIRNMTSIQVGILFLLSGCFVIHTTWAVLTYQHGIVTICVMLYLLLDTTTGTPRPAEGTMH